MLNDISKTMFGQSLDGFIAEFVENKDKHNQLSLDMALQDGLAKATAYTFLEVEGLEGHDRLPLDQCAKPKAPSRTPSISTNPTFNRKILKSIPLFSSVVQRRIRKQYKSYRGRQPSKFDASHSKRWWRLTIKLANYQFIVTEVTKIWHTTSLNIRWVRSRSLTFSQMTSNQF